MGEFVKNHNGNTTISVDINSKAEVIIYEWLISFPIPVGHWNKVTTIQPGSSWSHDIQGVIKYEVENRNFLSASDVPGGVDIHFADVWISTRISASAMAFKNYLGRSIGEMTDFACECNLESIKLQKAIQLADWLINNKWNELAPTIAGSDKLLFSKKLKDAFELAKDCVAKLP